MKTPKVAQSGKDPIQMMRMQMWAGLLAARVGRNQTDRQPHALRLELWRQLRPEQKFKFGMQSQQEVQVVQLTDYMAPKNVLLDDALFHFE